MTDRRCKTVRIKKDEARNGNEEKQQKERKRKKKKVKERYKNIRGIRNKQTTN